jgi:hypothetical protein
MTELFQGLLPEIREVSSFFPRKQSCGTIFIELYYKNYSQGEEKISFFKFTCLFPFIMQCNYMGVR